uniref:Uncharacterized protein n=1 Tax=Musa acuminata subsp. malaccensis TaxID=214687 RepID=A0A804JDG9_MUSAM
MKKIDPMVLFPIRQMASKQQCRSPLDL